MAKPDYIFKEYKGYIIGLDDSKTGSKRKMESHNLEDAKSYIDWLTSRDQNSIKVKTEIPSHKKGLKL